MDAQKPAIYLWKMMILNLNIQGEGHSFGNCLFHSLIISQKSLVFQILTRGILCTFQS